MRYILILLVSMFGMAHAGPLIARNGENWLRLSEAPCTTAPVLALLKDEFRDKFKSALARVNGTTFLACWIEQDGLAFIVYEDGDRSIFKISAFREEPSV